MRSRYILISLLVASLRGAVPGPLLSYGTYVPTCKVSAFTQVAIQTCLNSVAPGGVVFLPAGTYTLASALTIPAVAPFTITGVRGKSIIDGSSLGTYAFTLTGGAGTSNKGQTITNLVFRGAGFVIAGFNNTATYNLFKDVDQSQFAIRDNNVFGTTISYNTMTWTSVCTSLCGYHTQFYGTTEPWPIRVTFLHNYVDGAFQGVAIGQTACCNRGSNNVFSHNVCQHIYRMCIEYTNTSDGVDISNNYGADWVTGNATNLDFCSGLGTAVGYFDCDSFFISLVGSPTAVTVNNNRGYATLGTTCNGTFSPDPCVSWGIEMVAAAGQITVNNNVLFGAFNYGIWDDSDSGNTTANRGAVTNNVLCNIFNSQTRAQGGSPPWGGVTGGGNTYAGSCPSRDPVPCPPFNPATGGYPTGCTFT